jgi:hypothetical protein
MEASSRSCRRGTPRHAPVSALRLRLAAIADHAGGRVGGPYHRRRVRRGESARVCPVPRHSDQVEPRAGGPARAREGLRRVVRHELRRADPRDRIDPPAALRASRACDRPSPETTNPKPYSPKPGFRWPDRGLSSQPDRVLSSVVCPSAALTIAAVAVTSAATPFSPAPRVAPSPASLHRRLPRSA